MKQQTWECTEVRISLGVYVLGAIDPAERALVDAHLATCRECRDELAGMASLPALLARVSPEELGRIDSGAGGLTEEEAPQELISTVIDLAAARRRKTRWRFAAAAAAIVALAGGVLGGVTALSSPGPATLGADAAAARLWGPCDEEHYSAVSHATGAGAFLTVADRMWGTGLAVKVQGIPVGTDCDLFATMKDGTSRWVDDWVTSYDEGTVAYTGSLAVRADQITSFTVKAGGKTLVTIPTT
jgi:hypothetical protein